MKQAIIVISFLATAITCLIGGFCIGFFKGVEYFKSVPYQSKESA